MTTTNYLKWLVEEIHSVMVATIGDDGQPETRVIDMMLWDEQGLYFLTAKGKAFYEQLLAQQYIALSAVKDKAAISLRGKVRAIGTEKLAEIFAHNSYMQAIYPAGTESALVVFCLYEAQGEYFDISDPGHVVREAIVIGAPELAKRGYVINENCIACGQCAFSCPQQCIDLTGMIAVIDQHRCLHCGSCVDLCPVGAIEKMG